MSTATAWPLLPKRATHLNWLLHVCLGLIGIVALTEALSGMSSLLGLTPVFVSAFVTGLGFTGALRAASRLDETEGQR